MRAPHLVSTGLAAVVLAMLTLPSMAQPKQPAGQSFESPDAAAAALIEAARKKDRKQVLGILGPSAEEWITSGDPLQDAQARDRFIAAYDKKHAIEMESGDKAVLAVGEDGFPFPLPIVKGAAGWAFDPEQGKEEILDRRIGQNELNTIQVLLAITDAQLEYASVDWDGDGLRAYAPQFRSSAGKKDGLHWPTGEGEPPSPLGPLVAEAAREGYGTERRPSQGDETAPYHGYRFKLLKRQGADAPGGAYNYVVDGDMVGGFAVIAFPTKYGASGVMTFMVSHDGTAYETDLGPETEAEAQAIDEFDPGSDWNKVEPE
jgi:hypothetical protein